MSYLTMHAKVTIGKINFTAINSFEIEQSIDSISDTAKIVIARNYKELVNKKIIDYIKAGEPVTIQCGYNKKLATEFTGFVKPLVSADFPIEIECDQLFKLRQTNFIISERSLSLKQLLQRICVGYNIECVDAQLGKVYYSNESAVQILEKLKKECGFFTRIYNNTIYVGFAYNFKPSYTQQHRYIIGSNVREFNNLKYSSQIDFNTKVKVKIRRKNGKDEEVVYGMKENNGIYTPARFGDNKDKIRDEKAAVVEVRTVNTVSEAEAENIAKAHLQKLLYTGYKGNIDGFWQPQTKAGDSLTIINESAPEREGTYLINKVIVSYKEAELRRENHISYRIN